MRRTKTITRTFNISEGVAKIYKEGNDVLIRRPFRILGEPDPYKIMKEIEVLPDEKVLDIQIESTIHKTYTMPVEQFIRTARPLNPDDTEEVSNLPTTESEE